MEHDLKEAKKIILGEDEPTESDFALIPYMSREEHDSEMNKVIAEFLQKLRPLRDKLYNINSRFTDELNSIIEEYEARMNE
jgi:hypothetical protein